jgi:hypothetical protein
VGYEVSLWRRMPGQSFEDLIEDAGEDETGDDPGIVAAAEKVRGVAEGLFSEPETFSNDSGFEVIDHDTGLQLFYAWDGVGISVPYSDSGDPAHRIGLVYALTRIIETETGLEGWDQQIDQPTAAVTDLDLPIGAYRSAVRNIPTP